MRYSFLYHTPVGQIWIAEEDGAISDVRFEQVKDAQVMQTPLIRRASEQLSEYFDGQRSTFDLPLQAAGTVFQKTVWNALCTIAYGETRSYKDVAIAIGNDKACRAVGMANNKNPIAIIVPCHRVVGADGGLVGYGGGLDIKHALLDQEKKYKYNL